MEKTIPTIADVAKRAGVSTATVSRCLSSPDRVSAGTKERVLFAISELGYTPNFGAKALASKRTNTVGAVIPTMENAIFARGIQAFQEELQTSGATLLVASSNYDPKVEEEQIRTLISRGADALLLIGKTRSHGIEDFVEARGVASVCAWVIDPSNRLKTVGFDNKLAMKELVTEVLRLGHKSIAFVVAILDGNDRAQDRLDGAYEALRDAGLSPEKMPVVEVQYSIEQGASAFDDLYARYPHPTVIICGNDVLAAGALKRARELGIRVPEDISITGFDDIDLATIVCPALTTVHVPHREMGRQAAKRLMDMLAGNDAGKNASLDTHLVLRESLSPPS